MTELTPANKMLTVENVKNDHEILAEQYIITINGQAEDYNLLVDRWFSKTKINAYLEELRSKMLAFNRNKAEIIGENLLAYFILLAIRHFTSIDIPNDYGSQLVVLEHLNETGMFKQIVDQLPIGEMQTLFDEIIKVSDNIEDIREKLKEMFDEGSIELENDEVKNLLR